MINRPAVKCRSFYLRTSRSCGRAVTLITLGYPNVPHFHGHSTRKIHALIFTIACFRVLLGQAGSPFDVTAGLLPTDLLLSKLRSVSRRPAFHLPDSCPMPSIPGFLRAFVPSSTGLPILPMTRPQAASAGDCRAGSRRDSATPRYCDFALVFEARSDLRLAPPVASLCRANVSPH